MYEESPRPSILVVEDDQSMRELMRLHLANAGYRITVAPSTARTRPSSRRGRDSPRRSRHRTLALITGGGP